MRQKELRLALICYGGISLAVYMHGITKEIWRLTKASRNFHSKNAQGPDLITPSEQVYGTILNDLSEEFGLKLRILPDIIAGASAGGINGVFLAQALTSGQSLEPLTKLWLEKADIDQLLDPDARPISRFTKFWAQPLVWFALSRPGGAVEKTVSKQARHEVKTKLSSLIRARWFAPPFSGIGFSTLLYDAMMAMQKSQAGPRLIPVGQPLDLFVTATDYRGHLERMHLHSPPEVMETEHRLTIGFNMTRGKNDMLADPAELVFAARATASFPGAFPPFTVAEIDRLLNQKKLQWPNRSTFLKRILPQHFQRGKAEKAVLIDGSVLINAPFKQALDALRKRPAHREVDRRFVYIDPKPDCYNAEEQKKSGRSDKAQKGKENDNEIPSFFGTIFGAISDIPREQPIRDSLEGIDQQSNRVIRMQKIVDNLREDVDKTVAKLFGRTLFMDRPTPKRLSAWRNTAQEKAAQMAGFSYASYGQLKLNGIVEDIIFALNQAQNQSAQIYRKKLRQKIWDVLEEQGLNRLADQKGGATKTAIDFFRSQDLGFRIRRLRFLARRLGQDIASAGKAPPEAVITMHDTIYQCISLYLDRETKDQFGQSFDELTEIAMTDPQVVLDALADGRNLRSIDAVVDEQIGKALEVLPKASRREMLLSYLGFPFYDIATLPLLQGEGLDEFEPIKVDRISPDDAPSIRSGGANATLKGIEFNSFGAFFSRAYRENDYLWGRLHGAERMIDLVISAVDDASSVSAEKVQEYKRRIFHAILDEEEAMLVTDRALVPGLRRELNSKMPVPKNDRSPARKSSKRAKN